MLEGVSCVIADDSSQQLDRNTALAIKYKMTISAVCTNGEDALRAICRHRPTVAMLDIVMRGMSGVEVAKEVRKIAPGTKIVLVTASSQKAITDVDKSLYDYLLVKPFPDEWWLRAVASVVRKGGDPASGQR